VRERDGAVADRRVGSGEEGIGTSSAAELAVECGAGSGFEVDGAEVAVGGDWDAVE